MDPENSYQEDQDLLEAFKDDSTKEWAFTKIVRKYQERLYWHIRRMVVNHSDADDVLQNVFIKIWRYLENFRADSQLYTWMYRIATNETISFLNKEKRRRSISISDEETGMENVLKAEPGFDVSEIEWKLQMAMQRLPEKQKLVFSLRYYDEMPYAEMSKVLETSEGALKASYHHAVKKVEDYLKNN